MNDVNRLYNDLAWVWPIISPPEDYVKESGEYRKLILKYAERDVKTLLHLGCGGGHNDFWLKRHFQLTGVDKSPQMLGLARKLNPEVTYIEGDMRSVRLEGTFDAVVIFDSIAYMLSEDELRAAFGTVWEHLKPGGVFLTYAEEVKERFEQNRTKVITSQKDDIEIVFIENQYDPDPADTTYESTFIYLIREKGKLRIELDRHVLGLLPLEVWPRTLREVGFEVLMTTTEIDPADYPDLPTLIGIKPLD